MWYLGYSFRLSRITLVSEANILVLGQFKLHLHWERFFDRPHTSCQHSYVMLKFRSLAFYRLCPTDLISYDMAVNPGQHGPFLLLTKSSTDSLKLRELYLLTPKVNLAHELETSEALFVFRFVQVGKFQVALMLFLWSTVYLKIVTLGCVCTWPYFLWNIW